MSQDYYLTPQTSKKYTYNLIGTEAQVVRLRQELKAMFNALILIFFYNTGDSSRTKSKNKKAHISL